MTDISTGETLFAEGKVEEAEKCFLDLLKKEPSNAEALNDLGVIQHAKGNVEGAEDLFLKAIAAKQEHLDSRLNLVDLYRNAKRWSEAIAQLEECIQIENKDPNLFNMLGTFCLEMGNTEKARAALIRSLELNPDQELVRDYLKELEKKDAGPEIKVQEKPFNILFVQEAAAIRNYKMAKALRSRGHKVSLAYTKARPSQMYKELSDTIYNECIQLQNYRHLWDISKSYDIVHCHNEPDVLTVAALAGDAPVVHDTADLISLRADGDPNLSYFEGVANRGATGRVYSTPYQMEEAKQLYGVNGPSIVFYNYTSESDLPRQCLSKLSNQDGKVHIVYEGGIGGNGHRDFRSLFVDLAGRDVHVHIYPAFYNQDIAEYFSAFKEIHYNNPLPPKQIIQEMTQYDFGIIPFNLEKGNKRFLDSTIANKLFEYLAAGLPVIASSLKTYIDYFNQDPVGITFKDSKDIINNIPKLREIAATTDFSKKVFTYEKNIHSLVSFYREIMGLRCQKDRICESLNGNRPDVMTVSRQNKSGLSSNEQEGNQEINNPKNGLVMVGSYGSANLGDEMIGLSILKNLDIRKSIKHIGTFNPVLSKQLFGDVNLFHFSNPREAVQAIENSSGLLFGGGGVLYDYASPKQRMILYRIFLSAYALLRGRPIYFLNVGAADVRLERNRELLRNVLKYADFVSVRDRISLATLQEINIENEILLGADNLFVMYEYMKELRTEKRSLVGIEVRPIQQIVYNNPSKDEEIARKLAISLDYLYESYGLNIMFYSTYGHYDDVMLEKLQKYVVHKEAVGTLAFKNTNDLFHSIAQCQFLIGMSLHSLIFSALLGTKFIGIGYHPKINAFCEILNQGKYYLDYPDFSAKELKLIYDRILSDKDLDYEQVLQELHAAANNVNLSFTESLNSPVRYKNFQIESKELENLLKQYGVDWNSNSLNDEYNQQHLNAL